ncbi:hypothetical protein [Synechococcus sp. BA-132 BA5]|uniref:hypothetical protein n=1 Tax=Synechococcus sp. BA-132 BA5 TaxID=3110252 RepID=UPI002B20381D|nr:hypothetical protein [Synechococcus sp. BA-132 BA5]MEA5414029.1 hypothetical protein [Synechococcus sp. BA-132 BA5]
MGIRRRVLLAGLVLPFPSAALASAAPAPESPPPTCEARIRGVQREILGRNLATGSGPPLNAFQQLNPYALEQAAASTPSWPATPAAHPRLDALLLLPDRRGGAQRQPSPAITCMVSSTGGLPAVALPVALDGRGLPVGLEILGRCRPPDRWRPWRPLWIWPATTGWCRGWVGTPGAAAGARPSGVWSPPASGP